MAKYFKDTNHMKLLPSFDKFTRSKIRGNTVDCILTLNSTVIGEQNTLYVKIPKLEAGSWIILSSLKLTAKLKNKKDKSWFLNNISALSQRDIKVKFGKIDIYHNSQESKFLLYNDLWQSERDRKTKVDESIADENTRKLISGDDSGAGTGTDQKVKDRVIADSYKGEIVIPVGRILENRVYLLLGQLMLTLRWKLHFRKKKKLWWLKVPNLLLTMNSQS